MNKKSSMCYGVWLAASLLTGCSSVPLLGMMDDSPEINPSNLNAYVSNQDDVYKGLLQLANLANEPATPAEWQQFIMAGVQYSNQKCERYLSDTLTGNANTTARQTVQDLQRQYVEKLSANQYTNRVAAFSALQGYGKLCSPSNLQTLAAGKARVAQPGKSTDGGANLVPYVRIEP